MTSSSPKLGLLRKRVRRATAELASKSKKAAAQILLLDDDSITAPAEPALMSSPSASGSGSSAVVVVAAASSALSHQQQQQPPPVSSLLIHRRESNTNNSQCSEEEDDDDTSCSISGVADGSEHAAVIGGTATASGRSKSKSKRHLKWKEPYEPPPLINQSTILGFGLFIFVLAWIWPPLILLVAYLLSKLIPYSYRINDEASVRRKLFNEFSLHAAEEEELLASRHDDDLTVPENFKHIPSHIHLEESFWINDRGMNLCTVTMTPTHTTVKAVVCFCHGYCDNASYYKMVEYQRLVEQGIAFVAIEYEGHGRSDGPLALISDWDRMIDDVTTYFSEKVTTDARFPTNIPTFLVGESMGGAVAYSVYNRMPSLFKGVVFICPMCKIADDMLPPQWIIDVMKWLTGPRGSTSWLGYLPIAPAKNELKNLTHRDPAKCRAVSRCPTSFCRNPRLATARELVEVTKHISENLYDFDAPFLVLHGKADRVTDPKLSQLLYDESKSNDKSIRLYDGMWHALTCGEPDDNIDIVFKDCIEWILDRS